jgi:serine/threonine protein kinase
VALCLQSLVDILKTRHTLTEPEVRYYMAQLVTGCRYIHSKNVIHRDLKLGNMLLNEGMQVKIADFGLATRVEYKGEKKM